MKKTDALSYAKKNNLDDSKWGTFKCTEDWSVRKQFGDYYIDEWNLMVEEKEYVYFRGEASMEGMKKLMDIGIPSLLLMGGKDSITVIMLD